MLLPSALSCDSTLSSTNSRTRYQSSLFASPPLSPPSSTISTSTSTINNIYSSCRALQSMLTPSVPIPQQQQSQQPQHHQLPSPPTRHSSPPFKLRLRQRKATEEAPPLAPVPHQQRRRITKRSQVLPQRGVNKRRRALDEEVTRENEYLSEEIDVDSEVDEALSIPEQQPQRPSTPKRARIAPEQIPLGLERSDFHALHLQQMPLSTLNAQLDGEALESVEIHGGEEMENENERWSTEDDRILVELVLEKLQLSKSEWQDCARSLGKDRGSVSRRWKSLMANGDVGLKKRRGRIHGTWR